MGYPGPVAGDLPLKHPPQKEVLLKERTRKRAERAEARRVKAEEHHKAVSGITSRS
jgi:hypothetical protein